MNFSQSRKLRKPLSLALAACLTATLFAGCKKKEPAAPSTEDTSLGLNLNLNTTPTESTAPPTSESTEPTVKINENTGVVLSGINVRSSPSQDANIVATLSAGDRVEVVRREEMSGIAWGYITDPVGWIVLDYVKMDMEQANTGSDTSTPAGNGEVAPPAPTKPSNTGTQIQGTITANGLNVRSEPSKNGKVQGSYNKGDVVTILEIQNGWGRTNKGWINMDYVRTSATTGSGTTNTTPAPTTPSTTVSGNGSTTVQFRGIVIANQLNVRASASQSAERVGTYNYGKRVEFYQKDGNWGRTADGWISLSYVYQDGTTGKNTASGTITGNGLNVRSGPGKGYGVVGSLNSGDRVTILEQFTFGGTKWGCIKNGWISMDYVDLDGSDRNDNDDFGSSGNNNNFGSDDFTSGSRTGVVISTAGLRIRAGAGVGYEVVGAYTYNQTITILEIKDGWGRTYDGWVSMDYVELR